MITCKNCGYEGAYTGTPCPDCGTGLSLTKEELNKQLAILDDAIKSKRYQEILECYKMLADEGYTEAEREYAKILEKGQLTPRNLDMATDYFYRAATKNDPYSAYKYSRLVARANDEAGRFWLIYSAIIGCIDAYPEVAEEFSLRGYEEEAHYFWWLAACCNDVESIVTVSKRYYNGIGVEPSAEYAKWYMDKLRIPPIYAIKLAYKLRGVTAKEPPAVTLQKYTGLIRRLSLQAERLGFDTAYFRLIEILADKSDIESAALLGDALIQGKGCVPNLERALKVLTRAAVHGSQRAYVSLGNLYLDGKITEKNMTLALDYYKKAGECGSAESYKQIADIYYTGAGVEIDVPRAVEFYTLAGRAGLTDAQEKADQIKRERTSLYEAGLIKEKEDPQEAFRLYAIACAMGHPGATAKLAYSFEHGIGTKINRHGAFVWYKKAADLGELDALVPLGLCYANGVGVNRDFAKAKEILIKADKLGDRRAEKIIVTLMEQKTARLASRLYSAAMRLIHIKKLDAAKRRLEIAAELLHPKSTYTLGCMYEFGMGVLCDKEKAYNLYEKAYELLFRDPRARYKLKVLKMLKSVL